MNRYSITKSFACIALIGTAGFGATRASAETESNDTSATADVIALNFQFGGTESGKLRDGNVTPNPRDSDFYKVTNVHNFTSLNFEFSANPDGAQHLSYEVLTTGLTPVLPGSPFNLGSSTQTQTLNSVAPGTVFFIRVFDDGNLTTASSEASYTVTVTGTGGQNPLTRFLAKQKECKAHEGHIASAKTALKRAKTTAAKARARKAIALHTRLHNTCKAQLAALQRLI